MAELILSLKGNTGDLYRLQARLAHPAKVMAGIAAELLSQTEQAFDKEATPTSKWQPLAKSTIKAREKKSHWPGKMLQISGRLAASVTPASSDKSASLTSSKPYAAIQLLGGEAGRGHKAIIPSRRYMPIEKEGSDYKLNAQAEQSIRDMIDGFLSA